MAPLLLDASPRPGDDTEATGRPIARLVALSNASSRRRIPGAWRGRVSIADDFDELPAEVDAALRGERP